MIISPLNLLRSYLLCFAFTDTVIYSIILFFSIFIFGDYDIIISFLTSLSFLQTYLSMPFALFQMHRLFFFIVGGGSVDSGNSYDAVYVVSKYINAMCSFYIILLVCMCFHG